MGNSSSHSVQLAQTRLSFQSGEKQKAKKYACAVNRVLPSPTVGPKLRITDNGSILHGGGTISKRKHGRHESESNFSKLLQKNIEAKSVHGHRKSYSDPDVLRLMMATSKEDSENEQEVNRRSIIAMSPSKAKIKSKKRTHAPEPPQPNSLPSDATRLPSRCSSYTSIFQKKNSVLFIPPVPQTEDYIKKADSNSTPSCSDYGTNKYVLDKWGRSRSAESCTTAKEPKPVATENSDRRCNKPRNGYIDNKELKSNNLKEIVVAAYGRKHLSKSSSKEDGNKDKAESNITNLKRYYFDDVECLKVTNEKASVETTQKHGGGRKPEGISVPKAVITYKHKSSSDPHFITKGESKYSYQIEKMSLNNRQTMFTSQCNTKSGKASISLTNSLSEEDDAEIDIQLKPTLPKRQLEAARFSPTEVWKSIVVDLRSQQMYDLSSDEDVAEDRIQKVDKPLAPKRFITSRYEQHSDIPRDVRNYVKEDEINQALSVPFRQIKNLAWVPQQDLADDSDGEEAPHKVHNLPQVMSVQAKFTLPNSMFSGGQKIKPQEENSKGNGNRIRGKKSEKSNEHFSSLRNIKKAFGFRGKQAVDEQNCLDTNWSLSRSLPDFINHLHLSEKPNSKNPAGSPEIKADTIWQNTSLSTPTMPASEQEEKDARENNNILYATQYHVMYLPEYIVSGGEKYEVKKKTFAYQSTLRKIERKLLEDKLSKEIEEREKHRIKEKEWMEQVENEFRKQREREKMFKCLNAPDSGEFSNNPESSDNRWKHQTGMSKWLRYGRSQLEIRPEPEGGRSSADENKSEQKCRKKKENRFKQQHSVTATDFCYNSEKINNIGEEEYGIQTEIQRTDSGHTFQSHSYCMTKRRGKLHEDIKQDDVQTKDILQSGHIFGQRNKIPEMHLSKKRSSLDDSENLSDDDYVNNFEHRRRQSSGKRWKEADVSNKGNSSADKPLDSTTGFLRNHPLRNGARLKASAYYNYQSSKGRIQLEETLKNSIPIERQNGYSSNRYIS